MEKERACWRMRMMEMENGNFRKREGKEEVKQAL
jgi:hypothetical protein